MTIFRAYDIRGIYPKDLNEDWAYKIGRAFVLYLDCKNVVVGHDMRDSSKPLFDALTKGITDQGAQVTSIGLVTTPTVYFATATGGFDGSIMITASHNPKEYNGLKMSKKGSLPIGAGTGMEEIEALCKQYEDGNFPEPENKGTISNADVSEGYLAHNRTFLKGNELKDLTIVVDCANAMGALEFENLKKLLDESCTLIPLYLDLDGSFPNHEANPIEEENMKDLQNAVRTHNADVGIAFDGDADRAGFVDEKGSTVTSDIVTGIIAQKLLQDEPKQTILYDLRSSWATKEAIVAAGGTPMECKVGHPFFKRALREAPAAFGGELAGHFYFRDSFCTDSSMAAVLIMLQQISDAKKSGSSLSRIVQPFKKYFSSGELNSRVEDADAVIALLEEKYGEGHEVSKLDGIKIEYDNWWFNVRKSNTEPVIRLIVEATTKEMQEEKAQELLAIIRR